MTNEEVIRNWKHGRPGKSYSLTTDGSKLFSYRLRIGDTLSKNRKIIWDYQGTHSRTTTTHVRLAIRLLGTTADFASPKLKNKVKTITHRH